MERRYSFAPVDALFVTAREAASRLRVDRAQVYRWRKNGLTADQADRVAVAVGFDPYSLWPELLDDLIAEETRECAAPDCPVRFVLKHKGSHRRYCSDGCRFRSSNKRRRARPEVKAHYRAYQRAYHAAVREARARRAS